MNPPTTTPESSYSRDQTLFAELIVPVPVRKYFTYRVPAAWNDRIRVGQRVIVPFGARKILTGVVTRLHNTPPTEYEARYLLELLDETESITPLQFRLFEWMADYYMCSPGEVLNAALPAGLKLSSESMVQLHPAFNQEESPFDFSAKELMLINHLKSEPMSYSEVAKLLDAKSIYSILKSLTSKEAIILFETVKEKYRPKTEKRVRLQEKYTEKKELEHLFEQLAGKPKQEAVLLKYLQQVPVFQDASVNRQGMSRADLLDAEISESSLQTLVKNNILEIFDKVVPRFGTPAGATEHPVLLSEAQEKARNEILKGLEEHGTSLLFGVTGSGKTEIYVDLIRRALDGGSQVLYLLPEIALTTQIVTRLQRIIGSALGVYHSKFSDNERVEVWNGVLSGRFRFVIGVRSAVFLPFDNLGLIIVDEEHDPSYKQQDPAPRYHARDVARMMAHFHHAKVLLGTATPSCETYFQARAGKIGFVQLHERFGDAQLPAIAFANIARERKSKTLKGEFTSALLREIKSTLEQKGQVILFQNRRGHSPLVECEDCGWIPKCINCAVSLTYHQFRHALICHYCGYREELPKQCPSCGSKRILTLGYGTQKLEEELTLHFPDARIQRMDLDTTRTRSGYESILDEFERGETNILVGTQMVTKGLDFDKVRLVGVFDADRMMHFPDFRSYERAFQLIVQVSGRAGRRETAGKVLIQTSNPEQPLFSYVTRHAVTSFLDEQLEDREHHHYPPFARLIEITIKHMDRNISARAAQHLAMSIREKAGGFRLLGPGEPIISKIRNEYLNTILLKIPRDQGRLGAIKQTLLTLSDAMQEDKNYRGVKVVFDVDPV
ncbi:MAG: primosomal protein N' [Cyclobacteriaceae bacterium]|nr:primosomal protein N' [Cyclobacteriaceae bacterium]